MLSLFLIILLFRSSLPHGCSENSASFARRRQVKRPERRQFWRFSNRGEGIGGKALMDISMDIRGDICCGASTSGTTQCFGRVLRVKKSATQGQFRVLTRVDGDA